MDFAEVDVLVPQPGQTLHAIVADISTPTVYESMVETVIAKAEERGQDRPMRVPYTAEWEGNRVIVRCYI